ncbi:stress-response A/B barrel domain-containing protein HS1-like [Malus sylvestris]|uniref:stress-response A/B barrel domain-containing protein HS1-like n=1 Tax=Malus sylvestris TaxID=3752 RepID=UPI0021ABFA27|nr:stress-response A/B barrel domain-containing protein HS1-like [Malus sylvestris]
MEEAKGGELKNILMAKFKEGTSESQIEQLIESFANLVNLVEPMKSFHWGKELSIEKEEEGYIHVFETTFESVEGMAEYAIHPAHHDFAKLFLPNLEKMCSIGYRLVRRRDGTGWNGTGRNGTGRNGTKISCHVWY